MNQVSKLGNYLFQLLLVLVVTWKLGSFPNLGTAGKLHSFQTGKLLCTEVFHAVCEHDTKGGKDGQIAASG